MNSECGHPLHRGKGAIRLLIALLAVALALTGALVLSESESSEATSGNINSNLSYELIDGKLTISGTGAMPDTLYFADRTDVTSLVISEGVTHVGDGNFLRCTNLSSVELPSTLTSIGRDAFAHTAIQGVDLASLANLRTIGSEAFLGSSLTSVTIPATVTSVGNMAFADCSSLQSVTVRNSAIVEEEFWKDTALTTVDLEGVRTIDMWAFRDCSALRGIDLPSTLTYIEGQAFEDSGLTGTFMVDVDGVMLHENFLFGTGVTDLVITGNDVVFNGASNLSSLRTFRMLGADTLPYGAFALCTNLESVVLGHVRVIDEWAFYNCSSLSDVTVSGVEAINDMAFSGCSSLTSWDLTGVRSVGSSAFSGCTSLTSLTFPETRIDIGGYAFYGVPLTTLELPLVGNLSGYALDGMDRLTSAILHGDSSSQLGADIFDDCDALRSLTLQGFITIGEGAFVGLELDRLVLPDTLVIIGDGAFSGLHYGGPITLPESVRSIGMWAFGESTITGVTIPSGLVNIGFGAFFDNVLQYYEVSEGSEHFSSIDGVLFNADGTSLIAYPGGKADPRYVVPSDCVELCENAFAFSQHLCSITLHGGIQSIGYGALAAPSLEEILLAGPSTHFSVEDGVLFNADGTTLLIFPCGRAGSYTVPDGCTTIGEAAFAGTAISEVTLSDTVVRIQDGAFSWSALTSIVFGENLQYIGEEAFYGAGVTSLVLPDSLVDIGEAAFEQSALSTITLPAGLVSIGDRALMAYGLEEILLAGPSTRFSVVDGVLFNADGTILLAFPAGRVGSYVIPNGVVEIAERAFCGSVVTDVSFPALLTRIGDYAFQNSFIGVAMLPDSVTYVGVNAFYGCNALRLITVPAGATVTHERNGSTYGITNLRFFDDSSELTGQGVAGHTYERGMHREYGWEYEAFLLTTHVVPIVFGVYVDGYEGDYDGIAHPVTVSVSKNFEWDSVTYEWHRITTQGDSVLGVNSPTLSFTDVSQSGTYYVVISWTLDGDSDQRTSVPVDVTICPREVEKPEVLVEIPWDGRRHGFPSDTPAGASYTGDYRDLVQLGDWTEVTFTIDADNCVWSDGTTDPVVSRGVIVKADYDMSGVTFVDGSFVYDGTAHSLVITGDLPVGIDGVLLTVTYSGTATNVADGQVTVTATFATESQYYNVPEPMTALVSITKAPSSWSKLPVAANRIYDVYQRDLLTKGTAVGGDAQYNADGGTWGRNSPQKIDAGTYVVGYRIVGDDNHLDTAEAFLTVTIDQMDIGGCRWTVTSPIYNGTEKTATITVSTSLRTLRAVDYTIRAGTDRGINAGNYLVVVEGTGSCFGTLEIPWVIQKATVGFPSIDSQTYTGSELTATVPESDRYVVQTPATGIHVGSYSLTLRLTDPANYAWIGAVTETRTIDNAFQITKATNSFTTAPSIAGWTYGQTASEPVGTAMFGDIVYTYSSEEDGTYVSQRPSNAGDWYMKAVVVDCDDYSGLETKVSFTIAKATVGFPSIDSQTYTGSELTASVPASERYSVVTPARGTVVGAYPLTLELTDADNYTWSDVETAVKTVAGAFQIIKAKVAIPAADETVFTFNGNAQTYNVVTSDDYTVSGNVRTVSGLQAVTVTLNDPDNHEWTDGTVTDLSFVFVINKLSVAKPVADSTSFVYDGTEKTYSVTSSPWYTVYGDVRTLAGSQNVTVSLVNKDDSIWADSTVDDLTFTFTIAKATVEFPVIASQVYTGSVLTASVPASERYTVVTPAVGTAAGTYALTLELTDPANYTWSDVGTAVKTVSDAFQITKATNTFTTAPSIAGWTYGQTAADPVGTAAFGEIVFTYSHEENGTYVSQKPSTAGDWYMKASVADCADYFGLEVKVPFTVARAAVVAPVLASQVYTGSELEASVPESPRYSVVSTAVGTHVGTYDMVLRLTDADNYAWSDVDTATKVVTFEITKAINVFTTAPSIAGWTYGQTAASPVGAARFGDVAFTYSSEENGTYVAQRPSTAGDWYMKASVADCADYSGLEVKVPFTIAKAQIVIPEADTTVFTYNGSLQTYNVAASDDYTVSGNVRTASGTTS
ncbi:MAG: leucine-rich repeat domain-containing protein, partial [archaeon]|nr:leucine-rich repeat domain-containing protein [archaeon]